MTTRTVTMQPDPRHPYDSAVTFTVKGNIVRNEIGRAAMDDQIKRLLAQGQITGEEARMTQFARDVELDAFFSEYRKARASETAEQRAERRAEARAAHGRGVKLVDVISGEQWTT